MTLSNSGRFREIGRLCALGLLACFCAFASGCESYRTSQSIDDLQSPDFRKQQEAAVSLADSADPRAVDALIVALKDKNENVRASAAGALGRIMQANASRGIRDLRVIEALIAALKDQNFEVRGSAVSALGYTKDPRVVEPLITALKDENERVRMSAAWTLGVIGDPRAVEPLIAALALPTEGHAWFTGLRQALTTALARIGAPSVEPLIAALQDPNFGVRLGAAEALNKFNDPRAANALSGALDAMNELRMAQAFVNSRNSNLVTLAIKWAHKHGVKVEVVCLSAPGSCGNLDAFR